LAIKPRDNESFYREVDEELRRDQVRSYWERYGKLAIVGLVLFLGAIAGAIWWNNQKQVEAGKRSEQLVAAFDELAQGNRKRAVPKLDELAKSESGGHRAAALLSKAALAIEGNDLNAAAALYRQVHEDKKLPQPYRDLALVRMTHVEYDKLQPQAVIDRLKPMAVAGNPWFGSAGEMVAIAYLKLNKPQEAARIFAAMVKDQQVPDSARRRAQDMAGSLGVDAIQDSPAAAQEGTQ
jgi:hypothetical protein